MLENEGNNIFVSRHKAIPQRIIDAVNNEASKIGKNPTFRQFIEHTIPQSTYEKVESNFNNLIEYWKASGRDISDSEQVYNDLFNSVDSFLEGAEIELESRVIQKPKNYKAEFKKKLHEVNLFYVVVAIQFIAYPFLIQPSTFLENIVSYLISIIITLGFYYVTFYSFSSILKKNIYETAHWYKESFSVFISHKLWGNKKFRNILFGVVVVSLAIVRFRIFYLWSISTSMLILLGIGVAFLSKHKELFLLLQTSIIFVITIVSIYFLGKLGVYYFWFITNENLGVTLDLSMSNNWFFEKNVDKFETKGILNTTIFYLYPWVFLYVNLVTYFILGRVLNQTLNNQQLK